MDLTTPARPLGRANLLLKGWREETMLGTLKISKGAVVWFASGGSDGYRMGWRHRDARMQEHGKGFEERR